jgi:hypothetical protein
VYLRLDGSAAFAFAAAQPLHSRCKALDTGD